MNLAALGPVPQREFMRTLRSAAAVPLGWPEAATDRVGEARPVIAGVLHDEPGNPDIGLLEAGLLVRERRPFKAGEVLAAIAGRLRDAAQRKAHAELRAKVEELRLAGVLELDD